MGGGVGWEPLGFFSPPPPNPIEQRRKEGESALNESRSLPFESSENPHPTHSLSSFAPASAILPPAPALLFGRVFN